MLSRTVGAGFEITRRMEDADAIVVNTCSFIAPAIAEADEQIRQARRYKEHGRCRALIVGGCLPQYLQERRFAEYPYVDAWLTPDTPGSAGDVLRRLLAPAAAGAAPVAPEVSAALQPSVLPLPHFLSSAADGRVLSTPPSYAYVKIAEGCDHRCSFCIIPRLRGAYRSRPVADIVDEVRQLVAQGVPEIILVSQDCSYYGRDIAGAGLIPLLKALCAIDGDFWLRVLYLYPGALSRADIAAWHALGPKLLPYFDIPLQHTSPGLLQAMGRPAAPAAWQGLLAEIRELCPGAVVRTSLITGFPGETAAEFDGLRAWIESGAVDRAGVFAYSDLPEMASHALDGHVPQVEAERRRQLLLQAFACAHERSAQHLCGTRLEMVIEARQRNARTRQWDYSGRSWREAPGIDGVIYCSSPRKYSLFQRVPVRITGVAGVDLHATPIVES